MRTSDGSQMKLVYTLSINPILISLQADFQGKFRSILARLTSESAKSNQYFDYLDFL